MLCDKYEPSVVVLLWNDIASQVGDMLRHFVLLVTGTVPAPTMGGIR